MHRQPDRRLVRRRPLNPVPFVRRDVDEAGRHLQGSVLEPEPCSAHQDHDPLVLILVVPEAIGRSVAVGDDSLDADVGGIDEGLN